MFQILDTWFSDHIYISTLWYQTQRKHSAYLHCRSTLWIFTLPMQKRRRNVEIFPLLQPVRLRSKSHMLSTFQSTHQECFSSLYVFLWASSLTLPILSDSCPQHVLCCCEAGPYHWSCPKGWAGTLGWSATVPGSGGGTPPLPPPPPPPPSQLPVKRFK